MKKNKLSLTTVCSAAFLSAASAVIGYFCKYLTFAGGNIRITFENLPIIFSGILFGPVFGALTGICADLISTSVSAYSVNPFITAGACAVGLFAGLFFRLLKKAPRVRIVLSVFQAHIIGNMLIKSLALCFMYSTPLPVLLLRIPLYIFIAALETFLINLLLKNKGIKKVIKNEL